MGFQSSLNTQPAIEIEGDWADGNPIASMISGEGMLVAGPNGVTVGRFAWASSTGVVTNTNPGTAGARLGFVQKDQVVVIPGLLGTSGLTAIAGSPITLFDTGDFMVRFAGGAAVNQKVYVSYVDGSATAAATGATLPVSSSFTASISGTTLTVVAVSMGPIPSGAPISGAGVAAGTLILSQLTPSGSGSYGGAGTYQLNIAQTVSNETMTTAGGLETKWYVDTFANPGELAKITTRSAT